MQNENDTKPAAGSQENYLWLRWRRFLSLMPYVPATLKFVWQAAPRWMTFWACLLVAQGLVPVGVAFLARAMVNRVVEMLRSPQRNFSLIAPLVIVMATVLLLGELVSSLLTWAKAAQAEYIWSHVTEAVHAKSVAARMEFFDSPEFYDRVYRAQNEGPTRALTLVESMGAIAQDGITLLGVFAIVLPYGVWLPLMLAASMAPALFALFRYTVEQHKFRMRATPEYRRLAYYDSVLTGREAAPEIRLFGLGGWFQARHREIVDRLRKEHPLLPARTGRRICPWCPGPPPLRQIQLRGLFLALLSAALHAA